MLATDLERKILLQRGVHSHLESRIRMFAVALKIAFLALPAAVAFLAVADVSTLDAIGLKVAAEQTRALLALFGLALFVLSVLTETLGIEARHLGHRRAVESYTQLLRDLRGVVRSESVDRAVLDQLEKRYLSISDSSYKITDRQFERGESAYLRRTARRQARNREPFANPFRIWALSRQIANTNSAERAGQTDQSLRGDGA